MIYAALTKLDLTGMSKTRSNLLNTLYRQKVLFVHVPKCGGTSLSHALRMRYALSYFKLSEEASTAAAAGMATGPWMRFKRDLVAYHAHAGAHFVQGHIPVDRPFLDEHLKGFKRITLLREPVDRIVSHYFFDPRLRSLTPEQFLKSSRGFIETHVLCHFFGGLDWDDPGDVAAAERAAVATLDSFDVVGVLEEPAAFHGDLRERLGLRLTLPKRNVGVHREGRTLPSEIIVRIAEMCAADTRIYARFARLSAADNRSASR